MSRAKYLSSCSGPGISFALKAPRTSRIAAIEILKATSRTREYIERGETEGKSLVDAMEQGEVEGMQTFDGVLEKMINAGVVNRLAVRIGKREKDRLSLRSTVEKFLATKRSPGCS